MALRLLNILKRFEHITHKRSNRYKSSSNLNTSINNTQEIVITHEVGRASSSGKSTVNIPSKHIVTQLPPLTEPLKESPIAIYAKPSIEDEVTHVTTFSNGLRVASEKRFGQFCTIGVVIDSGPRYELSYPKGISHFLEKLAFQSTANFSSKDDILRELEKHSGICDCQSSRDTFIYASSIDNRGVESVTRLLADVTLRPNLTDYEVNVARQAISFELESLGMRPEQDLLLMDMIHAAAYKNNTLGFPKLCPPGNIDKISRELLFDYLRKHHTPERMVVAGVGVDHDTLVKNVEKYFVNEEAIWGSYVKGKVDKSTVKYTGGVVKEECDIPIYAAAGLPELSHVVIGLEACPHKDDDFIAGCVLNVIMGGGGSFSAGGPGKGMYTRLYTNVLNRYHWMYSATAYNNAYSDSGLFCIHASAPPRNVREMVEIIIRELVTMTLEPGSEELRRAKTQLQSMLLMNLESRPVVFEDIGRQVLANGYRKRPEYYINKIEQIKASDITNIARRILSSTPSVAARGRIRDLPELREVQEGLLSSDGKMPSFKRLSLFK